MGRAFESELAEAPRTTPEQLKAWVDAGEKVFIMDVRHEPDAEQIPGSVWIDPVHFLEIFNPKIAATKEQIIVAYCT